MASFEYKVTADLDFGEIEIDVIATTPDCRIKLNTNPNQLEISYKDYEKITGLLRSAFTAVASYKANGS